MTPPLPQAEEIIDASHLLEQYKRAVDASTIVSKTDLNGKITYANDEFCRVSKYERDELVGKPHSIVRHPGVPKPVFKELWKTIRAGHMWQGIVPNRAKDGSTYIVDATIFPITDKSGTITEYIAIRKNITELMEQRTLLEEYKSAVDASNIVSKTDLGGRITYANDEFCRISQYAREELIGKPHNIVRHPDVPGPVFKELWDTIQAGRIWKGIVPNRAKDGSTYIVDATVVPIKGADDAIVEYIAIRHDITGLSESQKTANEKNEATLEKIEQAVAIGVEEIVENIPVPAVALDGEDLVIAHNQAFDELFDMSSDDLTIQSLREKKLILSTLFNDKDESFIQFDPVFDWKLMFDPESAKVSLNTEEGEHVFRLAMRRYESSDEPRFILCFLEP